MISKQSERLYRQPKTTEGSIAFDTSAVQEDGSPSKLSPFKKRPRQVGMLRNNAFLFTSKIKKSLCLLALLAYVGMRIERSKQPRQNVLKASADIYFESSTRQNTESATLGGATTLALLYPPGLLGGYRNQVLRFIAFVVQAKRNNITQLLLPSLLWSTQISNPGIGRNSASGSTDAAMQWFPIPFSWIFDVDHWNTYSNNLPKLVNHDQLGSLRTDCWLQPSEVDGILQLYNETSRKVWSNQTNSHLLYYNYYPSQQPSSTMNTTNSPLIINHLQRVALLQGMIRPLAWNVTIPILTGQLVINSRLHNFAPVTDNCTNPRVYGGGTKAGILWNEYVSYQKRFSGTVIPVTSKQSETTNATSVPTGTDKSPVPFATDIWVYRALQPNQTWRNLANECISKHSATGNFIALHARIELEMMNHPCGADMEKNLTKILGHVNRLYNDLRQQAKETPPGDDRKNAPISGLFIAVSRSGMKVTNTNGNKRFRDFADENLRTLDRITKEPHQDYDSAVDSFLTLPVFECGEKLLDQYYGLHPNVPDHGSLLQSVVNFYIAVSSNVFVGVSGSSYSTDVLTTRYWLGKGATNYRYTQTGVEQVENGGLPVPHSNCKRNVAAN
jgi:hypothetical protein